MAGTIRIRRSLVEAAAEEIESTADELRRSHTIDGIWQADDLDALKTHDYLRQLVSRRREALA